MQPLSVSLTLNSGWFRCVEENISRAGRVLARPLKYCSAERKEQPLAVILSWLSIEKHYWTGKLCVRVNFSKYHEIISELTSTIFIFIFQTGMLSIVVPPDFIPEETSSDVIVREGGQVINISFLINYKWKFRLFIFQLELKIILRIFVMN